MQHNTPTDLVRGLKYYGILCQKCGKHVPLVLDDPDHPEVVHTVHGYRPHSYRTVATLPNIIPTR